jgi:hypothetical protein
VNDPVSICNLALGWVGQPPITSLDTDEDESDAARLCAQNYAPSVAVALEEAAPSFATWWDDIAPAAAAPRSPEFGKQFPLPADVLRVLKCDDGSGSFDLEWRREGQFILADCATLKVRSIHLLEDPKRWSPAFALAVAYRVGSLIAIPLTENRQLQGDLTQLYLAQVRKAAALDGTQGRREPARPSPIARARW